MRDRFSILVFLTLLGCTAIATQTSTPTTERKWQTIDSKDEFFVAMPEGSKGYTENDEYLYGRKRVRISKRVFVYEYIGGAALLVETIEGDCKGVRDERVANLMSGTTPHQLVKEQKINDADMSVLLRREGNTTDIQQYILFKNTLYVVRAEAIDETNPVVGQFLRSVRVSSGGKTFMPNLFPGDDAAAAASPPPIQVPISSTPAEELSLQDKPDIEALIVHRPMPPPNTLGGHNGQVLLKVLFLASGTVGKIEVLSGPDIWLRQIAIKMAEKMLFIPAQKNGKAVSIWRKVEYGFTSY